MVSGSIILGALALIQAKRYPEKVSRKIRLLAWLILLTPVFLGIGTLIYVFLPRHHQG